MGMTKMVTGVCDRCTVSHDRSSWTVAEERAALKEDGWKLTKNLIICPDCQDR